MVNILIQADKCIRCGHCVDVCPSKILEQLTPKGEIVVAHPENCIVCGHCSAACPTDALDHDAFPAETLHKIDYTAMPTPDEVELLIRARRSNRAFTDKPIPHDQLMRILEAAHRAPTGSNMQQVEFTLVTSPDKLREITEYTLETFADVMRKLENPLLKPLLKRMMPGAYNYIPTFRKLQEWYKGGYDGILRGATAAIFIHTPQESRLGHMDANLAYQNASLMAESMGVCQFYTGFVCAAYAQDKKGKLNAILNTDRKIQAGIALGIPKFRFPKYMDKKPLRFTEL